MSSFKFKQFEVVQDFSAMKVNTDAVLLGAWMGLPGENCCTEKRFKLLDIGTGTGIIALMAGQRLSHAGDAAQIDAVEIDADACKDAAQNFSSAPWPDITFQLYNTSLQEFAQEKTNGIYDLIFSNPPYFISSLKNNSQSKTIARHTDTLTQRELLFHSLALLKDNGRFTVILPVTEGEELLRKVEFMANAAVSKDAAEPVLFPARACYIHTVERKPAKRLMLEFVKCTPACSPSLVREQLIMMSEGSNTPQYDSLVGSFYLWGKE